MKIHNNPLRALQEGEAHRKPKTGAPGFEDLLSEQLKSGSAQNAEKLLADLKSSEGQPAAVQSLLLHSTAALGGIAEDKESGDDLLGLAGGQIDDLLTQWEGYAKALAAPQGADLKSAYGLLQGMSESLAPLRAMLPQLSTRNAGMAALVNELDVLATTESIKFNRGDYL